MTYDELAQGMAMTNHILLGNHAVNHTKGPTPMFALGHSPNLHLRNPSPTAYGRRTLGTAYGGCILEFTYIGGPGPFLTTSHG